MKKIAVIIFLAVALCISCKQKQAQTVQTPLQDTVQFFQVNQFLQKQIDEVNKTPYFIYELKTVNGSKDSLSINNKKFTELAEPFIKTDISSAELKPFYKENIFHDQTTKTITFSYSTPNKDLEVQSIDVLLDEDGQTLKRILIRKFIDYKDSSAIEQLSWKPNENFQINRVVEAKGEKDRSQQITVVWNDKMKEQSI